MFWRDLSVALTVAVLLIGARTWALYELKKLVNPGKEEKCASGR